MTDEEKKELLRRKFCFFVKNYAESKAEIKDKIGIKTIGILTNFCLKDNPANLSQVYMEAFERHYQIPLNIWKKRFPYDEEKMHKEIEKYRKELQKKKKLLLSDYHNPFESMVSDKKKKEILNTLKGKWYVYVHKEESDDIWIVELHIDEWGIVTYPHNNGKGFVNIRPRSSYIEKITALNETTVLIRFDNDKISYKIFYASVNTIDMSEGKPILNFIFFARKEYTKEEAKKILSSYKKSQLKLNLEFHTKIVNEQQY